MKTRIKLCHFMRGHCVVSAYTLHTFARGKWRPLGDDNGIRKFASKEEAEAEAERLKALVVKGGAQ